MKYKIVTSGETKVVTLAEISRNLRVQSEVFILSDKEIYLGLISHKTLTLFLVEFADYALQNYAKRKTPKAKICISLARKWLEDQSSISKEDLYASADYSCTSAAAYAVSYAAAYASGDVLDPDYVVTYTANAAGEDREKEFLRQGEFILDFLKSGKHLFLV